MTDYSKTKIYKIESHLGDKVYVGSTAKQYLSQRFQQHKSAYKGWKEGKVNKVTSYDLFDEYGPENCQIVLIEEYPCNSKDAKNAREGHYIKELNCVNRIVVGRTQEESQKAYQQSEKGKLTIKTYQQSDKGKEVIKTYQQSDKGKEVVKESIKKYQESDKGKETTKKVSINYYRANKEAILEKKKAIYHQKKAEKLEQEKQSEPITN